MNRRHLILFSAGVSQLILMSFMALPGADISWGRESFLLGQNSDFLGVFAGVFYSLIPSSPFGWWVNLTAIQLLCVICAFQIELYHKEIDKRRFVIYLVLQYLSLYFAAQQSRDGTLFAFLCLAFSLLRITFRVSASRGKITIYLSMLFFTLGLSFRPWMSVIVLPLLFFTINQSNMRTSLKVKSAIALATVVVSAPILTEFGLSSSISTKKDYPLQTLIIHDLVSTACWSSNLDTSESALRALKVVSQNSNFESNICQFFKPNTWQAVILAAEQSSLTQDYPPPLARTQSNAKYQELFRSWRQVILSDPRTYLQNKLMIMSQVFFASQTKIYEPRDLTGKERSFEAFTTILYILMFALNLPWLAVSSLYLLTPGIMILAFYILVPQVKSRIKYPTHFRIIPIMALTMTIWGTITFVSDNARYLTPFVLLTLVSVFASHSPTRGDCR
jgi:hypothetical protein